MTLCTTGVLLLTHEHWLTPVAGVPLLHRVFLSGSKVGVRHWVVLCRTHAPEIQQSLTAASKLRDLTWQVHDLQTLEPGRLTALLPQAEDVLLMTTPAAFDHRLLAALQEASTPTLGITSDLGVSQDRVCVRDGLVTLDTTSSPTVCCPAGLLRCSGLWLGQVMQQVWAAICQGPAPLATLLSGCLAQTTVQALDVGPYVWVPLTEPFKASVAVAESRLLRSLGRENESLFGRLVDRRLSQALTRRLMHTAVRPNQITLCSALIGLSGAFCLAQPDYLWQIVGSLLFLLSTIIDGCDGEMARLTFQESAFGAKLDVLMDNVVHVFLFPSIALGLYRREHDSTYLLLGGVTLAGIVVSMIVFLPYIWRRQTLHSTLARVHEHLASRDFAYALPVLALVDRLHWFLWATTVGTYVFALAWIVIVLRVQRQQRLLSGERPSSV